MLADRETLVERGPSTLASQLGPAKLKIIWLLLTVWLAAFGGALLFAARNWPMVQDAPILIYMGFLTEHGMRLYRDVTEVQFPGSVLLYSFGRHVFGSSDAGFRMFDLCALAVAFAAMMAIARRSGYWFAGVFGFAFFLWSQKGVKLSIINLGQRDFFISCMLGVGIACLIEALRRDEPRLLAVFGFCVAFGASIKPMAVLFVLPVVIVLLEMRRRERPLAPYLGWTTAGVAAGTALVIGFLLWKHALGAFIHVELRYIPLYVDIKYRTFRQMFRQLIDPPRMLLPLLAICGAGLVLFQRQLRQDREQQVLMLCALLGAAAFLLQHKGFDYHRAPFLFFFYLWAGWVLVGTMLHGRRELGWAALALTALAVASYPHLREKSTYDMWMIDTLQSDLTALHAADKPGEMQCLDTTFGCTTVALRMKAVTATGYTTDYLLFLDKHDPRLDELRQDFLSRFEAAKPRLVVLTNQQWPKTLDYGYDELAAWPEFKRRLNDEYTLTLERGGTEEHGRGYRIYTRKAAL
ncbi:MAG TPA: glycosyltransferase family 39 protein [Acidisarcina sp.]